MIEQDKQENLEERANENANNIKKYEPHFMASLSLAFIGGIAAEAGTIVLLSDYLQSKGYSPYNSLLLSGLPAVVAGLAGSVPGFLAICHYIKKSREGDKK
jgi:hypothetical protein